MRSELVIAVMFVVSCCTSLLVYLNRRRVEKRYASGGIMSSFAAYHVGSQNMGQLKDFERLPLPSSYPPMPPVEKPTTIAIKSYTKADLTEAFEQGRLKERSELARQLSDIRH